MPPYVKKADRMTAAARGPGYADDSDFVPGEDDVDLGIGVDQGVGSAVAPLDINALMAHPDFAKVVAAAVAAAQGSQPAPAAAAIPAGGGPDWDRFMEKLERVIGVASEQKPGYIKPLTADEMGARARGLADMKALLAQYKAEGVWPKYLLGDAFYGQSQNGLVLHPAGSEINARIPPADHFRPMNEPAARVYEAYKRWVGEIHDVGDLIASAMVQARGGPMQVSSGAPIAAESDVMIVEAPIRDVAPPRQMGTMVPEPRKVDARTLSGVAMGPTFVDENV